jgi:hypothetical protein
MNETFESSLLTLLRPENEQDFYLFDPGTQFQSQPSDEIALAKSLNAAFLIALTGKKHPDYPAARDLLAQFQASTQWADQANFYQDGLELVHQEIESQCRHDPVIEQRLHELSAWMADKNNLKDTKQTTRKIWSVFFPEAVGFWGHERERVEGLRAKRFVEVRELNQNPIADPENEILFTSNVLLTLPARSKTLDELPPSSKLKGEIQRILQEPQQYWYDHPIQIGVGADKNEVLYGLRGLEQAYAFERRRGEAGSDTKLSCVLSVSVTHPGLQGIAKRYLEEELERAGGLANLNVYVFTEADTQKIIADVLAPAARELLNAEDAKETLSFFGVDGEYGRHYSFLKAIAAFWNVFVDPQVKATFKIDLDQVFPQEVLVDETGASGLEHFTTPLWGASGLDSQGKPLTLGMIAGALVNESDISQSLFTPDVTFPNPDFNLSPDEHIFFSRLPQALSTQAEMMARYSEDGLDGETACLERIHVTGGTNGILVDSLRRYRPFTPSFFGRAEDQAYILSVIPDKEVRLAYLHAAGLIMRHDKEAFAQEAIQSAHTGKLIGDYIRILYYSAYARALTDDIDKLKDLVDPFTGCFISHIPVTVVYLRFALKAASLFSRGESQQGFEFIRSGAPRIAKALDFVMGEPSPLEQQYVKEKEGWQLYYDVLAHIEEGLQREDAFAMDLRRRARDIVRSCATVVQ